MALDAIIKGPGGTNTLAVDANGAAEVQLMDASGAALALGRNEAMGSQSGLPVMGQFLPGRLSRFVRVDSLGSQRVADPVPRLHDPIEVNMTTTTGAIWTQSVTTMAATVSAGVKTLNSASTLTTTTGVQEVSLQRFDRRLGVINRWRCRAMLKWGTVAGQGTNGVIDLGFGSPASVTAIAVTDGVFFRVTSGGALTIVSALNTTEQTLATIGTFSAGVITLTDGTIRVDSYYEWEISICGDYVVAQVLDPETGAVIYDNVFFVARTSIGLFQGSHVNVFHRVFNSGAATTACQLRVTSVGVEQLDSATNLSQADVLASLQRASNVVPTTQLQAANHANSAAPASATLSNTAAGYTTLGGQFQFAAVAGAETDYALFGFTVPTGYRFRCRRIRIDTWNTVVAVATTATVMSWAVSHNASTINLSTGTQFREEIGAQSFAVGAAVGALASPVEWTGNRVTESGRLFIIILKMPIATATATEIFRGLVSVDGDFE